jgi:hypothetical protein
MFILMRYSFIIFLALLPGTTYGQLPNRGSVKQNIDSLNPEAKNNIYCVAGTWIIGLDATLNYERMILHLGQRKSISLSLRAGYGKWAYWTSGGNGGILSANLIYFKRASHIETGFGAVILFDREKYEMDVIFEPPTSKKECMIYTPCINLGYRYQKPGGHSIFRIGFSYPEGAYAALGVAF